jgi:hypothetical protein
MSRKNVKISACDAETDPFLKMRVPQPFIWGHFDGRDFLTFDKTLDFVRFLKDRTEICYAHNGGKFDFMYLLEYLIEAGLDGFRLQIINSRVVSMHIGKCQLRDSFSAIPEALKKFGNKKDIDMKKLEKSVRHKHMTEIIEYLFADCAELYKAMEKYREIVGTKPTLSSNALAYAKKLGIDPGKTNHRFDRDLREYYFGGRTECLQPGTHKNITVIDINSAYPFAMMQEHASGDQRNFRVSDNLDGLDRAEIQRAFITVECDARGCFPKRSVNGGLGFPHERNIFNVTGWEYTTALDLGLINDVKILRVFASNKTIHFRPYVTHWYDYKNAHSETDENLKRKYPIEYVIGKQMMTNLYGKLSQNPANYYDYKIVKRGTHICYDPFTTNDRYCNKCGEKMLDHGWKWVTAFNAYELHARECLWKYKYRLGADWEQAPLYKNVATGASITGFTRAHLLRSGYAVGINSVIYMDTDSMFLTDQSDTSNIMLSPALGHWKIEAKNCPQGHFAGKKLYAVQLPSGEYKTANKGVRLSPADIIRVSNGEKVIWENDAPSFSILTGKLPFLETDIDKFFISREVKRTAGIIRP